MEDYYFAGWQFKDEPCGNGRMLVLERRIPNPYPPSAVISYHTYGKDGVTRESAAAWLISHWYEHFLKICPCIEDADADNNFRRSFIESILILEGAA